MKTFHDACNAIMRSEKANGYAKAYAKAGLSLSLEHQHTCKVQALYVLNNIQHWRGENSKEVREFLKAYAKDVM